MIWETIYELPKIILELMDLWIIFSLKILKFIRLYLWSLEEKPFQSDRFVYESDRPWRKYQSSQAEKMAWSQHFVLFFAEFVVFPLCFEPFPHSKCDPEIAWPHLHREILFCAEKRNYIVKWTVIERRHFYYFTCSLFKCTNK